MDNLPDHFLLPIAIRVAKSSIRNLFRFRAISLHHWKLLVQPEVLRALQRSYLFYLFDPKPCTEKTASLLESMLPALLLDFDAELTFQPCFVEILVIRLRLRASSKLLQFVYVRKLY